MNGKKTILKHFEGLCLGPYHAKIWMMEANTTEHPKCLYLYNFKLWHNRLGQTWSEMIYCIVSQSQGYHLNNMKIFQNMWASLPCLLQRKTDNETITTKSGERSLFERIQGICMDLSTPWVNYLSTLWYLSMHPPYCPINTCYLPII